MRNEHSENSKNSKGLVDAGVEGPSHGRGRETLQEDEEFHLAILIPSA